MLAKPAYREVRNYKFEVRYFPDMKFTRVRVYADGVLAFVYVRDGFHADKAAPLKNRSLSRPHDVMEALAKLDRLGFKQTVGQKPYIV